jgi:integrase
MLKEERKALRVMTLEEERGLVEAVRDSDPIVGAYVALLGETGLRKAEGLRLQWQHVNVNQRLVSIEETKSKRPRYVPLSDFAIESLNSLVRVIGNPYVFVSLESGQRWKDPRGPFEKGKLASKLDWVGFHDLRHFRATQWVRLGVDLRTVQELLGHSTITTTMRYAHFAPTHAMRSILQAQRAEKVELEKAGEKRATSEGER